MSSLPLETDETLVRPLPTVYPGVGVQTGGGGESLPTVLTPVGSVTSVGAGVASQQRGTVEHFLTEITTKQLLASSHQVFLSTRPSHHIVFTPRIRGVVSSPAKRNYDFYNKYEMKITK